MGKKSFLDRLGSEDARIDEYHFNPQTTRGRAIKTGFKAAVSVIARGNKSAKALGYVMGPIARGWELITTVTGNALGQGIYDYSHLHTDTSAWYRVTGTRHPSDIMIDYRRRLSRLKRQGQADSRPSMEEAPTFVVPLNITGRVPSRRGSRDIRLRLEEPASHQLLGLADSDASFGRVASPLSLGRYAGFNELTGLRSGFAAAVELSTTPELEWKMPGMIREPSSGISAFDTHINMPGFERDVLNPGFSQSFPDGFSWQRLGNSGSQSPWWNQGSYLGSLWNEGSRLGAGNSLSRSTAPGFTGLSSTPSASMPDWLSRYIASTSSAGASTMGSLRSIGSSLGSGADSRLGSSLRSGSNFGSGFGAQFGSAGRFGSGISPSFSLTTSPTLTLPGLSPTPLGAFNTSLNVPGLSGGVNQSPGGLTSAFGR